jgi:integrase
MAELTAVAVRNAPPREKAYRLAAGKGLYLQVMPTGAKYWRLKYRWGGVQKMVGLGVFPEVSLAEARAARDAARAQLAAGTDPSMQRRMEKLHQATTGDRSLRTMVAEHLAVMKSQWSATHYERVKTAIERDVDPWLGLRDVGTIEPGDLLAVLQRVQQRGALETAHRLRMWLGPAFRRGIVKGYARRDPTADLKGVLVAYERGHMPAITDPDSIGVLLRAIDSYAGTLVTRSALQLSALVFVRPGDLRWAKWSEFDLAEQAWEIPAARMKMRTTLKAKASPHLVPLSRQAVDILTNLYPLTGHSRAQYVFQGETRHDRPISENTLNQALHRMGFKGEMVAHGFRHMASTMLNELGQWRPDVIERQLAHKDKNTIRGIYNRAKYLSERLPMMQAWADYLDQLRAMRPAQGRRRAA